MAHEKAPAGAGALTEDDLIAGIASRNIDRRPYGQPFDLKVIDQLASGRLGTFDVPCPLCGPERRSPANQHRKVLRIWRLDPGFASFHCARCGEGGYAGDGSGRQIDPAVIERARAEAAERERIGKAERLSKSRWLWSQSRPIADTIADRYLRDARGYSGLLPATLRFLPARGAHGPAMLAAFGIMSEPEPGRVAVSDRALCGVHLTRLALDGLGKAGTDNDKIMVGMSAGSPIVLAPPNDLQGLAITEGIEDALSVHIATGLGAWAAGAASRLPALAEAVPEYVEAVTIYAHADQAGQQGARKLADALSRRGIEVFVEGLL